MKRCPACAETIQDAASVCRFCRTPLTAPPQRTDPGLALVIPIGRSPLAIVAGYLGLFSLCVVPAPIALIVSLLAMRDLQRDPKLLGWGRAIFGLVMGILGTLALLGYGVVAILDARK